MDCIVCVHKYLHEWLHIHFVHLTKSLAHEPKKLLVGPLLGAAVDDHVTELLLLARLDVQLVQFVNCLLEVQGRLDGQVDSSPERNEISLSRVHDGLLLFLLLIIRVIRGAARPGASIAATAAAFK